jgi:hypothetical protein
MPLHLIALYYWVCQCYDTHPHLKSQRQSPNECPVFTDVELVTIYLFGHLQGHHQQKAIHRYITQHWMSWFPQLPSYQAFSRRLGDLTTAFECLVGQSLATLEFWPDDTKTRLVDSLPIMLSQGRRSRRAKVAAQAADQGYCAVRGCYDHGLKLHLSAAARPHQLPAARQVFFTPASHHDLRAVKEHLRPEAGLCYLSDKAYADATWQAELRDRMAIEWRTPYKRSRNEQRIPPGEALWSSFCRSLRQPIESLFDWINDQVGLSNAARVRSDAGLWLHCFGKLAAALYFFILRFNP